MTEKQKAFCDFYLQSFNGTQSAIRAGYSEKSAYAIAEQNLRKLEIQNYIKTRTQEASNSRIMTVTELKEFWTKVAKGEENGADFKDRLKASEYIGKSEAVFTDRIEANHNFPKGIEINFIDGK